MKKGIVSVILSTLCASTAHAGMQPLLEHKGVYIGFLVARTNTNPSLQDARSTVTEGVLDGRFYSGRLYVGYQAFQHLGIEFGVSIYHSTRYRQIEASDIATTDNKMQYNTIAPDLLLRITIPLVTGIGMDLLGGGAYVHRYNMEGPAGLRLSNRLASWTPAPVAGVGANYMLADDIALKVTYLHTFGRATLNSIDSYGLGLQYTFA